MEISFRRFSWYLFAFLLGATPVLFYPLLCFFPFPFVFFGVDPQFSELFEVPKMYFVYFITSLLLILHGLRSVLAKRLHLQRSRMDVLLILVIVVSVLSAFFSVDIFSSVFGYPTRLHGGLLSLLVYITLFWLYRASEFSHHEIRQHMWVVFFTTSVISIYGIGQYFGLDRMLWEQDVQARVFASIGQPNWFAAYLVLVIGITAWLLSSAKNIGETILLSGGLLLMNVALILSRSRSGIIALGVLLATIIFAFIRLKMRQHRFSRKGLLLLLVPFCLLIFYRTNLGADETTHIRLLVWRGAWDIFLAHPIVGSGLETFASSFYLYRPIGLLETAEWDFLYNKAHNEFLHVLATTGILGFGVYVTVGISFLMLAYKKLILCDDWRDTLQFSSLLGGWIGLSVTNFFGFSTVLIGIFTVVYLILLMNEFPNKKMAIRQWHGYILLFCGVVGLWGTLVLARADMVFAQARSAQTRGEVLQVIDYQSRAAHLIPFNPWYHSDLGYSYALAAQSLYKQQADPLLISQFAGKAREHTQHSVDYAPMHPLIWRKAAASYAALATIDVETYEIYLVSASDEVWRLAPTDIKLRMGLVEYYELAGENEKAERLYHELSQLKPDVFRERME